MAVSKLNQFSTLTFLRTLFVMSNAQAPMTNKIPSPKSQTKYDLEERTAVFGERIIDFSRSLPKDQATIVLSNQLIRSGTSVGANYLEADASSTKKDFRFKISLCRKEAKESRHWLRMITKANPESTNEAKQLWQEAQELVFIFSAILKK